MNRNRIRILALAAAALSWVPTTGFAQAAYPTGTIRIVAGAQPGGLMDFLARLVATEMQKEWGQGVIVENKPGAAGLLGANYVQTAKPDGYTLLIAPGAHTIAPALHAKLAWDPVRDFTPVTMLVSAPNALIVRADHPAQTVADYINLAKTKPKGLSYATGGVGSTVHFAGELLSSKAAINLVHVPYASATVSVGAVLSGEVDSSWSAVNAAMPMIKSGKVRALGVAAARRVADLPNVPTFEEQGLAGFRSDTWYGILAPAGTPTAVTEKLNQFLTTFLKRPDISERLIASGADPVGLPLDQFGDRMRAEVPQYKALAEKAGIKPQ
jgi:tripartite-type tricarboxylate transporter receptor subunit TctC